MKKIKMHHFGGKNICTTWDEVAQTLEQTVDGVNEFYIAGADAVACVKSTCYNMAKNGYAVHVLSDCITSYDKKKIPEMLSYYERNGCRIETLKSVLSKNV